MSDHVFGPVPSRRFGRSLGINVVPRKTCNYSCLYCQLGRTLKIQRERALFFSTSEVMADIDRALRDRGDEVDFVTFMGDGEPTLAENLGEISDGVRKIWTGRTALITNGSLFFLPEVRRDSMGFSVVSPTVAAGDEETFRRIHRPGRGFDLEKLLHGLEEFRARYEGQIWAEVMLIRGINDDRRSLEGIRAAVERIGADRVHINTPIRPPCEKGVFPPSKESLRLALEILPRAVDLSAPEQGEFAPPRDHPVVQLLEIAKNHPLREEQALSMLTGNLGSRAATDVLSELVDNGSLERVHHEGITFYRVPLRPRHVQE